jgi:hypothetical protein
VNEHLARNFHVSVGDSVTVRLFAPDQGGDVAQGIYAPEGPTFVMKVAAIVRPASDIAVDDARTTVSRFRGNEMVVLFDFWEQHHHEFLASVSSTSSTSGDSSHHSCSARRRRPQRFVRRGARASFTRCGDPAPGVTEVLPGKVCGRSPGDRSAAVFITSSHEGAIE